MSKWIYGGVFLFEGWKKYLIEEFKNEIPEDWDDVKLFCHHMTILFNSGEGKYNADIKQYIDEHLNENVQLKITKIGLSDKAIALFVDSNIPCANKIKHITYATGNGGKPVESNNISNWKILPKPIIVEGTIKYHTN